MPLSRSVEVNLFVRPWYSSGESRGYTSKYLCAPGTVKSNPAKYKTTANGGRVRNQPARACRLRYKQIEKFKNHLEEKPTLLKADFTQCSWLPFSNPESLTLLCMCKCMCVCMWEREREREGGRGTITGSKFPTLAITLDFRGDWSVTNSVEIYYIHTASGNFG